MLRYSLIEKGMKREFLLLQGTGCRWRKCTFCDYHTDVSEDPYAVNKDVLSLVSGRYGVLDIINSGSCFEFDQNTIALIQKTAAKKNIHTLWFEAHWMYRKHLKDFASLFPGVDVKFRVGVESFNGKLRERWKKGIPESVGAEEIASYFNGCCLLVGVKGETKQDILDDIFLADKYFEYFSVNLFCPNSTGEETDEELSYFVKTEIRKKLEDNSKAELLIENTDLGVG